MFFYAESSDLSPFAREDFINLTPYMHDRQRSGTDALIYAAQNPAPPAPPEKLSHSQWYKKKFSSILKKNQDNYDVAVVKMLKDVADNSTHYKKFMQLLIKHLPESIEQGLGSVIYRKMRHLVIARGRQVSKHSDIAGFLFSIDESSSFSQFLNDLNKEIKRAPRVMKTYENVFRKALQRAGGNEAYAAKTLLEKYASRRIGKLHFKDQVSRVLNRRSPDTAEDVMRELKKALTTREPLREVNPSGHMFALIRTIVDQAGLDHHKYGVDAINHAIQLANRGIQPRQSSSITT